jgi:GntR family transcriptional regulator
MSMAVAMKSCALAREPLYAQVCDLLARRIADGTWKPNAALPNEMELAREMGVSAGTVRKALEKLEADRVVVRRQGRGTFVVDQAAPEAASRFDRLRHGNDAPLAGTARLLQQSGGEPTLSEQRMLQIGPEGRVVRKRRLLTVSGRPFAVESTCLAVGRLAGLAPDASDVGGVGDWNLAALAQRHGVHLARAYEEVRPVPAEGETAALLGVDAGATLMLLDRVIISIEQAPIEWRSAACHLRGEYYLAEMA